MIIPKVGTRESHAALNAAPARDSRQHATKPDGMPHYSTTNKYQYSTRAFSSVQIWREHCEAKIFQTNTISMVVTRYRWSMHATTNNCNRNRTRYDGTGIGTNWFYVEWIFNMWKGHVVSHGLLGFCFVVWVCFVPGMGHPTQSETGRRNSMTILRFGHQLFGRPC